MCDIQTAVALLGPTGGKKKMGLDKEFVQVVFMACLTALGITAIVVDGEIGMAIAVAVAGAIGYMAKGIVSKMGGEKDETEVQK